MKPYFEMKKNGATRLIFLIGGLAIKIPTFHSWELFLYGLLGNIQERRFRAMYHAAQEKSLPPVLFSLPGGFLVVQKRIRPIKHKGFFALALAETIATSTLDKEFWLNDAKIENFGYMNGLLVKIDIGTRY